MKLLSTSALGLLTAFFVLPAQGALTAWKAEAEGISSNVVADTTTHTFSGTGTAYSFGNLDDDGSSTTIGAGAAFEFIFNAADTGASLVLAKYEGWNGENTLLKLEQWNNTGVFGITIPGANDWQFPGAPSVFDSTTHVVFNNRTDGEIELYVNGASMGTATRGAWIVNGDMAGQTNYLGGAPSEGLNGSIFGVATYDAALSSTQITDLYNASLVPEPSIGLLGLISLGFLARRRR